MSHVCYPHNTAIHCKSPIALGNCCSPVGVVRHDRPRWRLLWVLEGPFLLLVVPLTVQNPPASVPLSPGADLHVHMRLHGIRRSPSRLVCIVIISSSDDVTWVTSFTPMCPLLHRVHSNVVTARVLCRLHRHVVRAPHLQLTRVLTLDDATCITSRVSKCAHYAIHDSLRSAQRFAMHRASPWYDHMRNLITEGHCNRQCLYSPFAPGTTDSSGKFFTHRKEQTTTTTSTAWQPQYTMTKSIARVNPSRRQEIPQ